MPEEPNFLHVVNDNVGRKSKKTRGGLSFFYYSVFTVSGLKKAQVSYAGNLRGLRETTRSGDLLVLVSRPQEVVAALQPLALKPREEMWRHVENVPYFPAR